MEAAMLERGEEMVLGVTNAIIRNGYEASTSQVISYLQEKFDESVADAEIFSVLGYMEESNIIESEVVPAKGLRTAYRIHRLKQNTLKSDTKESFEDIVPQKT